MNKSIVPASRPLSRRAFIRYGGAMTALVSFVSWAFPRREKRALSMKEASFYHSGKGHD
jgi:hypothetical protein